MAVTQLSPCALPGRRYGSFLRAPIPVFVGDTVTPWLAGEAPAISLAVGPAADAAAVLGSDAWSDMAVRLDRGDVTLVGARDGDALTISAAIADIAAVLGEEAALTAVFLPTVDLVAPLAADVVVTPITLDLDIEERIALRGVLDHLKIFDLAPGLRVVFVTRDDRATPLAEIRLVTVPADQRLVTVPRDPRRTPH